jgi:hypothetical protein
VRRAIPSNLDGLRSLLASHRDRGWELATFLEETEVDPLDIYRGGRSWTSLQAEVGLATLPADEAEVEALSNIQKLLHVSDAQRLPAWRKLVRLEAPASTAS